MPPPRGPEILNFWHHALVQSIRDQAPDLTSRQMAILLSVYMTTPPHTVRGLARELNVAKPVVTRAIDALSKLGYLKRAKDEADKRNIFIQRTVVGAVYLRDFADMVDEAAESYAA